MTEQLYTSSRLKVLRQCLRLHFFRYVLGIQTPSSESARFGTTCHAALEAWYRAWQSHADRLAAALAVVDSSDLSPYDQARLRALVVAYDTRWGGEPWEVIAVETEFRYELGGRVIGGKIDALIRDLRDGRVYVVEHKSTGQDASAGSVYWERLSIDSQVSIYIDGATMLGHDVAGCIYDVLQRPRHEPKLATPEHEREYTKGKGCTKCGGLAKPGAIAKGAGCETCGSTGWKEAPRLVARHRDSDETLDEFTDRLVNEIADALDTYLVRGVVVRLDDELPRMRQDVIDTIEIAEAAEAKNAHPRNPDACTKFNALCPFFDACAHRASIEDQSRFPRGAAHPELATVAA